MTLQRPNYEAACDRCRKTDGFMKISRATAVGEGLVRNDVVVVERFRYGSVNAPQELLGEFLKSGTVKLG